MKSTLFRPLLLLALAQILLPQAAFALVVGEAEVHSYLGQPLEVRIPLSANRGETISESCFSLSAPGTIGTDGIGFLRQGRLTLSDSKSGQQLIVTGLVSVGDPLIRLQLNVKCANQGQLVREYTLLVDPPPVTAEVAAPLVNGPAAATAAAPTAASLAAPGRGWIVRSGDTAASIARTAHPKNRLAQGRLAEKIIAANPILVGLQKQDRLPEGAEIVIPELDAPIKAVAPASAKIVHREKGRHKTTRANKARAPVAPIPRQNTSVGASGFQLKLSAPVIDLALSQTMTDEARAKLREKQLMMDSDDQVSNMLALKNSVKELQSQLAEMQKRLAQAAPARAPTAATAATAQAPASAMPPAAAPVTAISKPAGAMPSITTPEDQPAAIRLLLDYWWAAVPILALLSALGLSLWRRRQLQRHHYQDLYEDALTESTSPTVSSQPGMDWVKAVKSDSESLKQDLETLKTLQSEPATPAGGLTATATTVTANAGENLKHRYIEQRFPEIEHGTAKVADADSVINLARLYYQEDRDPVKAAELLQYAISLHPKEPRKWLALFEIYHQENMRAAFDYWAKKFRDHFAGTEYWTQVQRMGKAIDVDNAGYTAHVSPSPEKNLSNQVTPEAELGATERHIDFNVSEQPSEETTESVLSAPLDFTQEFLADDLRSSILRDLQPKAAPHGSATDQVTDSATIGNK